LAQRLIDEGLRSRTFGRSRKNAGPPIEALHAWVASGPPTAALTEAWLLPRHEP
jgi:hypothetical protein